MTPGEIWTHRRHVTVEIRDSRSRCLEGHQVCDWLRLAATGCDWRLAWAEANAIPSTQHFECLGLDFGVENPSGTAEAEIFPYSEADSPQEFLRVLRAGSGKHLKFMDRS